MMKFGFSVAASHSHKRPTSVGVVSFSIPGAPPIGGTEEEWAKYVRSTGDATATYTHGWRDIPGALPDDKGNTGKTREKSRSVNLQLAADFLPPVEEPKEQAAEQQPAEQPAGKGGKGKGKGKLPADRGGVDGAAAERVEELNGVA